MALTAIATKETLNCDVYENGTILCSMVITVYNVGRVIVTKDLEKTGQ